MRTVVIRLLQLAVMLAFAVLISDFRKREGSEPLLPTDAGVVLKLIYPVPFLIYLFVVLRLREFGSRELFALALTIIGCALVGRARLDIGRSYTWTGYRQSHPALVTQGIYGVLRHPIYTGIWLFITGGIVTVFGRVSLAAHVAAILCLAYIGIFLIMAATRETRFLAASFGDGFERYRARVGAVGPRLVRR